MSKKLDTELARVLAEMTEVELLRYRSAEAAVEMASGAPDSYWSDWRDLEDGPGIQYNGPLAASGQLMDCTSSAQVILEAEAEMSRVVSAAASRLNARN